MSAKLVSIIMPAYHSHEFIAASVDSILKQTYRNWELLIISDDGSNYESLFAKSPQIKFCSTSSSRSGPSVARNIGIDNANGDVIATLDSDDKFHPQKLELMIGRCLEFGLVTSNLHRVISNDEPVDAAECKLDGKLSAEDYLAVNFSSNSHIMFDRKRLDLRYPEYIRYLEDLTLPISAFDKIEHSFHFKQPLHTWVVRKNSASNLKDAPKRFIEAKKLILQKIDDGTIGLSKDSTITAFRNFVEVSLACEKVFDHLIASTDEVIDFTDIFITEISKLYPTRIYEYKNKTYINGKIN